MVQIADKQASTSANRVASAVANRNRVRSHFDDLLTSPEELSKNRLANELASELWKRLPISRAADQSGERDIEHTLRIATSSTSQVQSWYGELRDFIAAIAKAATELRGEVLSEALQDELCADMERQMLEQVRYPLPSRSFVDFKFADLSPAEAWTQAQHRLEQECLKFANHVFALFDTLQQQNVIGQIQETTSTCRFTFFRRVAIAAPPKNRNEKRTRRDPDFQIPGHTVFLEETFQVSDYDIQHRHAQCVHHVRNPVLNRPEATVNPLPEKYSRLIDACPNWLAGSVRVLEGELFREERIEWDLHTDKRTEERVIERVRRCPAVLFGPYILAGWGELAIKAEENTKREVEDATFRQAIAKKARVNQCLSFAIAAAAVGAILFTGTATAFTTSLAILVGLAAMALAGYSAHQTMVSRGQLFAGRVLLHSTLIGATIFTLQALLFSIMHWSLSAFGLAVLAGATAAIASFLKNGDAELGGSRVG